ncbi:MAG: hypothetical protein RLZZ182_1865 [Pseudomonadota bacterium]|jgi:uncharacterized protein YbaR (Trm112 family)
MDSAMDTRLIELLVCPVCKGPLQRSDDRNDLICHADRLAFPIRDGIPVMLESEARSLDAPAAPSAPAASELPAAD